MSDVPLGMFLSGGIDSSAVAALMARMIDRPLADLLGGVRGRAFNELEYAREVARAIGADAHEVVIDDRDFFDALPQLVWHEDEPIAHPSSVPLYFVSALARQHVTVVLTGEGSDELLAGYGKYPRIAWNWRAGTVYERLLPRRGATRRSRAASSRGCPGVLGRYAQPVVPRDGPHAGVDVLRQLRVDPPGRPAAAARRPRSADGDAGAGLRARRSRYFDRAERQRARCSIGCSTPTSRPTWSSC